MVHVLAPRTESCDQGSEKTKRPVAVLTGPAFFNLGGAFRVELYLMMVTVSATVFPVLAAPLVAVTVSV